MHLHLPAIAPRTTCATACLSLRPLAISAGVRDALAFSDPQVKAGHRHGASLTLAGTGDAIFMSAPGAGLLPAHVVVRARDLGRVLDAIESRVASGENLSLRLDIEGVRTFRSRLTPCSADMRSVRARANIAAVAQWLRAGADPLGLGVTADAVLAPGGDWLNSVIELQHDARSAESVLRRLIGLGAGTTPAGDDFSTGALAHAWVTLGREAPIAAALRSLEAALPGLTTATGATCLRAAVRGEFGSHLVAWVRALPRVSPSRALALALRVAGHGATSGFDTLAGFVAAAAATDSANCSRLQAAKARPEDHPVSSVQALV